MSNEIKKMNTAELIAFIARTQDISKAEVKRALDSVIKGLTAATATCEYDEIRVGSFGTIKVSEVAEGTARNPRTGEIVPVPAHNKVAFKLSKTIKEAVR